MMDVVATTNNHNEDFRKFEVSSDIFPELNMLLLGAFPDNEFGCYNPPMFGI